MSFHETAALSGSVIAGRGAPPALQVLVILPAGHTLFSLSILLDLLSAANHVAGHARFICRTAGPGAALPGLHALEEGAAPDHCLVMIADGDRPQALPADLVQGLCRLWRRGGHVGAWGNGCLALAAAGLLQSGRFALAAGDRPALAAGWPRLVPAERSFCDDGRVLTSVGQSVLSDMVLHLIRDRCGSGVMTAVMDHCLIRRTPDEGRSMLPPRPADRNRIDPRLAALDRWIDRNMGRSLKAQDLAPAVGLSVRQLERLFVRHMDRTPADHLDHKRMSRALKLMRETGLSLDQIARETGHPCTATFRKKFRRRFGTWPAGSQGHVHPDQRKVHP